MMQTRGNGFCCVVFFTQRLLSFFIVSISTSCRVFFLFSLSLVRCAMVMIRLTD